MEDLVSFLECISEHIKLEKQELDVDTNITLEKNSVYEHEPLCERSRVYFHELAVVTYDTENRFQYVTYCTEFHYTNNIADIAGGAHVSFERYQTIVSILSQQ